MAKKIMLIDGNSIINRAFYALPILTNKNGEYTNAVFGFLNIFFKLYNEENPDYLAVAFDLPKPTFRHLKFTEYKGTRKGMPEELRPQVPMLKNLLGKMRIPIYEMECFEADDVLGTMAVKARAAGITVVIISGDRDLLQLADMDIKVRIPKTKGGKTEVEDYTEADVIDKMGMTPKEFIDYKALLGDASDNIPGVPGIGEKTALKIIQEYKTLENAIACADNITPKRAALNLKEFQDQAILSKELATIITDVPLDFNANDLIVRNIYTVEALDEVKRLEFKSFVNLFSKKASAEPASMQISLDDEIFAGSVNDVHIFENGGLETVSEDSSHLESVSVDLNKKRIIINLNDAVEYTESISKSATDIIAFDILRFGDKLLGASIKAGERDSVFILVDGSEISGGLSKNEFLEVIRDICQSECKKIVLDSKKDMSFLCKNSIELKNVIFDATLAAYILSSKSNYGYEDIAFEYLNESMPSQEEVFGKGAKAVYEIKTEEQKSYALNVTDVIYRSFPVMNDLLSVNGQSKLYYEIELPLAEVLNDMELYGIRVNEEELARFGKSIEGHIDYLTNSIYEYAGGTFNINSPIQLGSILFDADKLGLKGTKKTKQGYSTAADVLEKLADQHPIIPLIMEYRTYTKLKNTYVDGLISVIDKKTKKIYSTFNQTVTSTGRISSTEPNLQNIPIRLELGRQLRKAFVPSDGFVFMDGDYSQIELRVLAHMAKDETLINAFKEGQDIHRLTASQVFNVPFDEVTSAQRSNAKAVNFGIVYGISAFSLSQDLGIRVKDADMYIEGYFKKYPKVREYLDEAIAGAKENGYAETIFNRRRAIPELFSSNFVNRMFGERVAMNMPVQGSAADIIKIAMIRVHKKLKDEKMKSRLILQVHDELLIEAAITEKEQVKAIIKQEMENAVELLVPLEVDVHEGENWYETK